MPGADAKWASEAPSQDRADAKWASEAPANEKFNPGQARVPSGQPGGGQWTDGDGGGDNPFGRTPDGTPIDPASNPGQPDPPPKVPDRKPSSSKETTSVLKTVGRWLQRHGGTLGRVVGVGSWIWEYKEEITSYFDAPKTLDELHDAVGRPPEKGYQNHHIVEQGAARQDGFPEDQINGRDNVVRIPTLKHYEINGWYGRKSREFGGRSPREYLKDEPWSERYRVGRRALIENGVLKP